MALTWMQEEVAESSLEDLGAQLVLVVLVHRVQDHRILPLLHHHLLHQFHHFLQATQKQRQGKQAPAMRFLTQS